MANEIGNTLLNSLTKSTFDVGNMAKVLAEADVAGPLSIVERKTEKYNTELGALSYLQQNLSAFNTYAKDLASQSLFTQRSISSSNDSVVSASVTGTPTAASYNIESVQLAQAHTEVSGVTFASKTDVIGADGETLTINGQPVITLDATNNSLEGLQTAINAAGVGVTASIINNGGQYQLMMTSNETGAASQFTIGGTLADPGKLDFDVVRDALNNPLTAGQDAIMKLNGVTLSSSSNTFDEVIDGVSFTLHSASAGVQSVNVSQDSGQVVDAIKSFVEVYNQLNTILKDLGSYETLTEADRENPEKEFTGDLAGSSLLRDLKTQLREAMTGTLSGVSGSFDSLASIGISIDRYGVLQLDEAQLNAAASTNMDAISALFASGGTSTDPLVNVTGTNEKTLEGSYALNVTQAATRATVSGDTAIATGGVDLSGLSEPERTFSISVDGSTSVNIVMAEQNYASDQEFADAMVAAINANSEVVAAGGRVSAGFDASNNLTLTSNRFGANSSVEMSAFAAAGFSAATGVVNGQNVDGTLTMSNGSTLNIGAYADAADGRVVKISDFAVAGGEAADVRGLQFEVNGMPAPGTTIDVTKGYAGKVFETVNNILEADTGLIGQRIGSLNDRLGELEDKREKIDLRYEKMELKYRMQFSMMQSIMSQMQETQNFLTQTYNRPAQQ